MHPSGLDVITDRIGRMDSHDASQSYSQPCSATYLSTPEHFSKPSLTIQAFSTAVKVACRQIAVICKNNKAEARANMSFAS